MWAKISFKDELSTLHQDSDARRTITGMSQNEQLGGVFSLAFYFQRTQSKNAEVTKTASSPLSTHMDHVWEESSFKPLT